MNVWIMNLKDNRDEIPADLSQSKFEFCRDRGIVGIGWAKPETENAGDVAFSQAENAIDSFEIGDLVWFKNPSAENDAEKYYVCKITEKAVKTDDGTMNKYDIGKYCSCEYIPVQSLPEELESERLVAVHTIEKANETVGEKTQNLINSLSGKRRKSKAKIGITAGICASVFVLFLILGIIFVPKAINYVNMKTHPILPDGLEFGMTYDEIKKSTDYLAEYDDSVFANSYDELNRNYFAMSSNEPSQHWPLFSLTETGIDMSFNKDKQLYKISFLGASKEDTERFEVLCKYFEKAFGITAETREEGWYGDETTTTADFYRDGISCIFEKRMCLVTIESEKYQPQIPEISGETINDAFNKLNYNIGGYSINLRELLSKCVSNADMVYYRIQDVRYKQDIIDSDDIAELTDGNYAEYAATSYVITVHGDLCLNPDLPYLKTNDIDVIKILMIFNDSGKTMGYKIIEECDDLYTSAALRLFR